MLCRCGQPIEPDRIKIGLDLCMKCGDLEAARELGKKRTRVGPIYNKGPDQYLGDEATTRRTLVEGGGRKHIPIQYSRQSTPTQGLPKFARRTKVFVGKGSRKLNRGKIVGMVFEGESRRLLYEKEDPSKVKGRVVLFAAETK